MAGQLTIDTLKASSGVLATQNGMTGIAKAWVNFNGSTATIRSSFNVSSITRNATGDYTVNFTTTMPDANYSALAGAEAGTSGLTVNVYSYTTTNAKLYCFANTGSNIDRTLVSFTANGN